ncbi:hypothetical protein LRB59_01460 [Borreliella burgdorferi]|uniref:Uncharacterized protein n=1 Tax=Borreliella burgdorferi 118a TaxID=476210 RepID=A0A7U8F244_BORBG|nr:hypothetical protein [Borreliella burgdorferi]ADQ29102.1 conserved hypothetical protein [Borreliella burgdorferi N40]ATH10073.1 hypothetical protein BHT49_02665 [Borreliella burgdorferi]AXK70515.1 hypothetical protein BbuMM1_05150 [Borreliella burgdorferi]EEC21753.1 conserved hypothetical protein [Borreliella burgdorferi 156a]EEE18253.1 conserved hypothetical protein [Borreliella burgdorferi 72a]
MDTQIYELIFLTSFSIFLIVNLFNFKKEFTYEDYFIIFPGTFFVITLYFTEIRPLMLYIGSIFLIFMIIIFFKNIKTIVNSRRRINNRSTKQSKGIFLSILLKTILVMPAILTVIIATIFSYLALFINYPKDENNSYQLGFARIKDHKNDLNLSIWYPVSSTLGLKKQNPFLLYEFNPFFINEMNYLSKQNNIYKKALISNNQKLYDSVLLILPYYSHDSMFKSLVSRLVKKGKIVYLYSPKYKHMKSYDFIKNSHKSIFSYVINKSISYLIEPANILNEKADIASTETDIQNIIELAKSSQNLEFLNSKMNLNKLTLITLGNQANIANFILAKNTNIAKYINIGGEPQTIRNLKNLQLILKENEKNLHTKVANTKSIKLTDISNIAEISDLIFSRNYLKSFNFLKNKKSMLSRFNSIVNEINKFIEEEK